jgi:RNA recognition motif-containing protein
MISKKMSDEEVKGLFVPFGSIEECRVLRTTDGQSRGCAFVTFNNKNQAQNAIRGLHQSRTLEGCSAPVVVKFADTQKDKERKKLQMQLSQMGPLGHLSGLSSLIGSQSALQQAVGTIGSGLNQNNNPVQNVFPALNDLLNTDSEENSSFFEFECEKRFCHIFLTSITVFLPSVPSQKPITEDSRAWPIIISVEPSAQAVYSAW